MLDLAIQEFLDERKAARIKGKIKATMSEDEIHNLMQEADELFLLNNWLPNAAKRAAQLSLVTHVGKFSHPNAKTSSIIAKNAAKKDGFLRTGNVPKEFDVFGNAAALDVYKFLSLILTNGQTILEQLEQETDPLKDQFTLAGSSYEEIKTGLLAIKKQDAVKISSERVKQVYFPVGNDYHLLSLLTPSGLMYQLKQNINNIRFSEQAKQSRILKKKNEYDEQGFDEIYGLTAIGYGGTKPQNISIINSQNGGVSYLLSSMPPVLNQQNIRLPKTDFFRNALYYKNYAESFKSLDKLMKLERNTVHIRAGIDNIIGFIITQVIERSWLLRQLDAGWSEKTALKQYQKIWLDSAYQEQRENDETWLNEVMNELSRWIIFAYEKSIGHAAINTEMLAIKALISEQKEGLL